MKNITLSCFATILLSLFFSVSISAQKTSDLECGTIISPEYKQYLKQMKPQIEYFENQYFEMLQNRSSTTITAVPIKAHIIRTSAGTGGLSESDLNDAIADMNVFYANAFMEFFLCDGINYIDDDNLYDFETNDEAAMRTAHNVANLINIYFTDTVINSTSGNSLCGYAYTPGGPDTILMKNSCATNGSTLPHEVGHFFSLLHTHGPSNSVQTTELVDGSNCDTDGDYICDTPADPKLGYSNVNSSCIYTGIASDANGDFFTPDPRNIMSYSRKECRDIFTPGQYARIYATYQTIRNNFACPSFNVAISSDYSPGCETNVTVNFTDNSTGATSWQWDVNGDDIIDYTTQNPSHTYSTAGEYDVALTISNGSQTISRVYSKYIPIGSDVFTSTNKIELHLTTDNYSNETTWSFKDSSGAVLYSGGPYDGSTQDNTLFVETFDVSPDECYTFTINDSYGDGICCGEGNGSYELKAFDGTVLTSGSSFGAKAETTIANTTLGLNDSILDDLKLYPNPVAGHLSIKMRGFELPDSIEIYNMLGQQVLKRKINSRADLTINTLTFSQGIYYAKVSKASDSVSLPFIKK